MRIIVDADACPTKSIIEEVAFNNNVDVVMVFDTAHQYESEYSTVIIVDKGADSVDQEILRLTRKNDIVVTQDYGLAALALAKGCKALNQNGMIYSEFNIDLLLDQRYYSAKLRKSGLRAKNQKKREVSDDSKFREALNYLISLWCKISLNLWLYLSIHLQYYKYIV